MKKYIRSLRLRTLPLSLSGILLGSCYATTSQQLNLSIMVLALLTTAALQILSNLSNELGDALKGTDNGNREGMQYGLQQGIITEKELRRAIRFFIFLSSHLGMLLIYTTYHSLTSPKALFISALGILAIIASIKYTLGKHAYGYMGLGDIAVFLFFGLVSTCGVYYLHTDSLSSTIFWLGSAEGLLAVGVLNVNNVRDMKNDRQSGKHTLASLLGNKIAIIYHYALISIAFLCFIIVHMYSPLLFIPIMGIHLYQMSTKKGKSLDAQLPLLSFSTLGITFACCLEIILS